MISFENMAAYVCHYGGTPKPEIKKMYTENKRMFEETGNPVYRDRAERFLALLEMMDGGVRFVSHEQASTYYYEPEEGWQIIHKYLH